MKRIRGEPTFLRVVNADEEAPKADPYLLTEPTKSLETVSYIRRITDPNFNWHQLTNNDQATVTRIFTSCATRLIADSGVAKFVSHDHEFEGVKPLTEVFSSCHSFEESCPAEILQTPTRLAREVLLNHLVTYAQRRSKGGASAHNPAFTFLLEYSANHPEIAHRLEYELTPEGKTILPSFENRANEEKEITELGETLNRCDSIEEVLGVLTMQPGHTVFSNPAIDRRYTIDTQKIITEIINRVHELNIEKIIIESHTKAQIDAGITEDYVATVKKILQKPWGRFNGKIGDFNIIKFLSEQAQKHMSSVAEYLAKNKKLKPLHERNGWMEVMWYGELKIHTNTRFSVRQKEPGGPDRIYTTGAEVLQIIEEIPTDETGTVIEKLPATATAHSSPDVRLLAILRMKLEQFVIKK